MARRRTAGVSALLVFLFVLQAFVLGAAPVGASHIPSTGGLPDNCSKVDSDEVGVDGVSRTIGGITITIEEWIGEGPEYKSFAYSVTGDTSDVVVHWQAKAGTEAPEGVIRPPSGTVTITTQQSISHVTFCVFPIPDVSVSPVCIPEGDELAPVVVDVETGFQVYIIDSDDVVVAVVGALGRTVFLPAGDYTWFAYDITDTNKTPFVEGEFTIDDCPVEPGDADVVVTFGCDDNDDYVVTYSVSDASIVWTVNGESAAVTSGQVFAPGTEVSWVATADEGFVFDDGDDVEGSFTAESCVEDPRDADVVVTFGCDDNDDYVVTYSVSDASIVWTVNGESAAVTSGQVFAPGTEVSWVATADEGFVFDDGDDVEGSFTAETCSTPQTSTTTTTQPTTTTTQPAPAVVTVSGVCVTDSVSGVGTATLTVSVSPAGGATVTIDGVGAFSADAVIPGLPDDTTYSYTVTPAPGGTATVSSGSVEVSDCDVEVLGTVVTSTTVEAVTVSTLPFTGFESQQMLLMGLVVVAGGLLLLAVGRSRDSQRGMHRSTR